MSDLLNQSIANNKVGSLLLITWLISSEEEEDPLGFSLINALLRLLLMEGEGEREREALGGFHTNTYRRIA